MPLTAVLFCTWGMKGPYGFLATVFQLLFDCGNECIQRFDLLRVQSLELFADVNLTDPLPEPHLSSSS